MLRWLDCLEESEACQAALAALPGTMRDVHAEPAHLAVYARHYGWRAWLAHYRGASSDIVQPYLLDSNKQLRHVFNFGGPMHSPGITMEDWALYAVEGAYLKYKHGVAREYCSYNPMLAQQRVAGARHVKDVVYMNLGDIEAGLRSNTRRSIAAAKKRGVIVSRIGPILNRNASSFYSVYATTMERLGAAEHWRFSSIFFEQLLGALARNAFFLFAYAGGEIEAACLVLHGHGRAYYHLAGSYMKYPASQASALMLLRAAEEARELGCATLHLGGGVSAAPNDGLLQFKSGFSELRAPYYVYEETMDATQAA